MTALPRTPNTVIRVVSQRSDLDGRAAILDADRRWWLLADLENAAVQLNPFQVDSIFDHTVLAIPAELVEQQLRSQDAEAPVAVEDPDSGPEPGRWEAALVADARDRTSGRWRQTEIWDDDDLVGERWERWVPDVVAPTGLWTVVADVDGDGVPFLLTPTGWLQGDLAATDLDVTKALEDGWAVVNAGIE